MKVAGMATIIGRDEECSMALRSLVNQVDRIELHRNLGYGEGLTDNGKFKILETINEPCYVFLCDDDILYPHDYIEKTIEAIDKHGCIVSYHGRQLRGLNRDYYRKHKGFGCFRDEIEECELDVCGTGVTAFHTDYFFPKGLHLAKDKLMSDLVFSLEAAKQGKKIMHIPHKLGWLKDLRAKSELSIYYNENKKADRQKEIANEIFLIKN